MQTMGSWGLSKHKKILRRFHYILFDLWPDLVFPLVDNCHCRSQNWKKKKPQTPMPKNQTLLVSNTLHGYHLFEGSLPSNMPQDITCIIIVQAHIMVQFVGLLGLTLLEHPIWLILKLSLTCSSSRFCMGMVQNQHQSIQDPFLLLCPTLKIEHLNPTTFLKLGIIVLTTPSIRKLPPHYAPQPHYGKHLPYQWLNVLGVSKT